MKCLFTTPVFCHSHKVGNIPMPPPGTTTHSNLRPDENKDSEGKRKTALTCECIVKEVRDTEVVVAWEEVGVPVDEWDEDPQPLQLHTLEKGTEWKLLTFTGTREGQQVLYKRGLLQDLGRGNKRRRGGA